MFSANPREQVTDLLVVVAHEKDRQRILHELSQAQEIDTNPAMSDVQEAPAMSFGLPNTSAPAGADRPALPEDSIVRGGRVTSEQPTRTPSLADVADQPVTAHGQPPAAINDYSFADEHAVGRRPAEGPEEMAGELRPNMPAGSSGGLTNSPAVGTTQPGNTTADGPYILRLHITVQGEGTLPPRFAGAKVMTPASAPRDIRFDPSVLDLGKRPQSPRSTAQPTATQP